jgi:hypothetical protein
VIVPDKRALHSEELPHPRGVAASGFRPLRNIPHCCLPKESGPCLSPRLADHPLRPATRRRLGRPLPHQQTDRPQTHLEATCAFSHRPRRNRATCGISSSFPLLSPTSRQVVYVLLNRSPLTLAGPFDLHTLGTPLAFVLSQDQTLHENSLAPSHREGTWNCCCSPATPTEAEAPYEQRGYHSKAHLTSRHFPTV